jgi:hypothetical protein
MNAGVMAGSVVVVGLTVVAVVFSCVCLRSRVSKHRPYALALAAPAVPLAAAGIVLAVTGSAFATVPVWCGAVVCAAAAWTFWPVRQRAWDGFERAFWAHVARRQEFHVRERDGA